MLGDLVVIVDEVDFGDVDKFCRGLIELFVVEVGGLLIVYLQLDGELDVEVFVGMDLFDEIVLN